jgi:hypothetical protein
VNVAADLQVELEDQDHDFQSGVEVVAELDRPIDKLDKSTPEGEKRHEKVLNYLKHRIDSSEREMTRFHSRWRANEQRVQAYITLPDYDKTLKEMQEKKMAPPLALPLVVPFAYAAHSTICTFLVHTFCGRRPLFPIGSYKDEAVQNARHMEEMLQYQSDHIRLVKKLWQHFSDVTLYGLGAFWTEWEVVKAMRTVREQKLVTNPLGGTVPVMGRTRKERVVYEGNAVENIDPYLFFPDHRVPMTEVNTRGETVFQRTFTSLMTLMKMETAGDLKYVGKIPRGTTEINKYGASWSNRSLLSEGEPIPGQTGLQVPGTEFDSDYFVQLDQGTAQIIPSKLELSASEKPELWYFAIGNMGQILAAEPVDDDHGKHRVSVCEPTSFGYGFGQPSMMDFIGPIQDLISWFVNSHVENVRLHLNNIFVYDPHMIERKDLERPGPGKNIRLKPSAQGQDVRQAIMQMQVFDVTANHPKDVELMMRLGQLMLGFNENVMGVPQQGGRKTATEMRIAGEAAISRLALLARIISAQSITDLTEQMSLNTQQYLSEEFAATVLGADGQKILLTPEHLVGDFTYPVHDGVLPPDRLALFEIWKEGTQAIAQDQELRAQYDIGKMVEYTMELGGARNIEQFKRAPAPAGLPPGAVPGSSVQPNEVVEAGAQAGNLIPVQQALQGLMRGA